MLLALAGDRPQRSSASSWTFRQQKASERWTEKRPNNLQGLIEKEAVGHPLCCLCPKPAVIRCRECLPEEWFCGDCDVLHHKKQPLHNRECLIRGFFEPIPPTTRVMKGEDGYFTQEQACILPTVSVSNCVCDGTTFTVLPGKPVILININGRYDLHQPLYVCQTCQQQRTPDMKHFLQNRPSQSSWSIAPSVEDDLDISKTCQRLLDETAKLAELHCSDEMVSQWISDVKEWAAGETQDTSDNLQGTTHTGLQRSIEGLYLSVRQRKQNLYRQNVLSRAFNRLLLVILDSNKLCHRLRRKLAEDKKLLLQEIQKHNKLDSAANIDAAVVEHSLSGALCPQ
ncbi:unnamed protein product [Gadus morhua 'NCC']